MSEKRPAVGRPVLVLAVLLVIAVIGWGSAWYDDYDAEQVALEEQRVNDSIAEAQAHRDLHVGIAVRAYNYTMAGWKSIDPDADSVQRALHDSITGIVKKDMEDWIKSLGTGDLLITIDTVVYRE